MLLLTQSKSKTQKQQVCTVSSIVILLTFIGHNKVSMSRKGPDVGEGMLDFVEDNYVGVKSH